MPATHKEQVLATVTISALQKLLQMIIAGLSTLSCQGPGYFLTRQNYVKARILYSYYLLLTDLLGSFSPHPEDGWDFSSTSHTPLHL